MLAAFFEAVRFLTLIPLPFLPAKTDADYERTVARATLWFPLVGCLIGGLGGAAGWIAGLFWGELTRAVIVVVTIGVVTSGLHLDGLSDTFDGLMSWRPRERKLEIMKDSRIGAMGALALIAVFALKVAFIAAAGEGWLPAVLASTTLGRWADVYSIYCFPPAREGGLGRRFQTFTRRRDLVLATIQAIAILLVIYGIGAPASDWPAAWLRAGLAAGLVLLIAHALAARWTRMLGGLTGDTYGALCEIGEVVALAALSARP
jgi:adenosylcobinamide-GDP ribazoletransferase